LKIPPVLGTWSSGCWPWFHGRANPTWGIGLANERDFGSVADEHGIGGENQFFDLMEVQLGWIG